MRGGKTRRLGHEECMEDVIHTAVRNRAGKGERGSGGHDVTEYLAVDTEVVQPRVPKSFFPTSPIVRTYVSLVVSPEVWCSSGDVGKETRSYAID